MAPIFGYPERYTQSGIPYLTCFEQTDAPHPVRISIPYRAQGVHWCRVHGIRDVERSADGGRIGDFCLSLWVAFGAACPRYSADTFSLQTVGGNQTRQSHGAGDSEPSVGNAFSLQNIKSAFAAAGKGTKTVYAGGKAVKTEYYQSGP